MEGLSIFTTIILIVFGILQIILFFKIWGMTDDVREIKEKYIRSEITDNSDKQNKIKEQPNTEYKDRVLTWNNKQEKSL